MHAISIEEKKKFIRKELKNYFDVTEKKDEFTGDYSKGIFPKHSNFTCFPSSTDKDFALPSEQSYLIYHSEFDVRMSMVDSNGYVAYILNITFRNCSHIRPMKDFAVYFKNFDDEVLTLTEGTLTTKSYPLDGATLHCNMVQMNLDNEAVSFIRKGTCKTSIRFDNIVFDSYFFEKNYFDEMEFLFDEKLSSPDTIDAIYDDICLKKSVSEKRDAERAIKNIPINQTDVLHSFISNPNDIAEIQKLSSICQKHHMESDILKFINAIENKYNVTTIENEIKDLQASFSKYKKCGMIMIVFGIISVILGAIFYDGSDIIAGVISVGDILFCVGGILFWGGIKYRKKQPIFGPEASRLINDFNEKTKFL